MPARAILVALALSVSGPALADCKEPETGTKNIPIFSPPLSAVVPKDELITYAQSNDGWSSPRPATTSRAG
jgi:hypothetical protein